MIDHYTLASLLGYDTLAIEKSSYYLKHQAFTCIFSVHKVYILIICQQMSLVLQRNTAPLVDGL